MQELGIDAALVTAVLRGEKTIEGQLGKPKYLKLRVGDQLSIRADTWEHGKIIHSEPDQTRIIIKQLLYFESFAEMLESLNYKLALPDADSVDDAIDSYLRHSTEADEYEYGVVAITFDLTTDAVQGSATIES